MTIPQWLYDFWVANRSDIIVSLVTGLLFFVLGPIGVWFSGRRIRQERVRRAKESLLDLFEGMLVSQEKVDTEKLTALFRAVERQVGINLEADYGAESLLGDLALRFEKSKHLDATQKDDYFRTVRQLAEEIRNEERKAQVEPVPRAYSRITTELRAAIANNDQQAASRLVGELEERLVPFGPAEELVLRPFKSYRRLYRTSPTLALAGPIILLLIYVVILVSIVWHSP